MVLIIACKFNTAMDRSRKTISQVLLRWTSITDLMKVQQKTQESVPDHLQRFRDVRSRCFKLKLEDRELAAMAFDGLLPHIKEKYSAQEFDSLSHMMQRLANVDTKTFESKNRSFPKKVANVGIEVDTDEDSDPEIGLAEWV
jgi:hypothetical protein